MDQGVKQAVVIGAGFIGLELVENFMRQGIATTVIELQDQVLPPFDKEMTTPIGEHLAEKGFQDNARGEAGVAGGGGAARSRGPLLTGGGWGW